MTQEDSFGSRSPELRLGWPVNKKILLKAFRLASMAKSMAEVYEQNSSITAKYVHATSRGHEAIQITVGLQMRSYDYASLYYRDDSMLLALGFEPFELMLQLLAKRDDPFSGGRSYYCHPNVKQENLPTIPHQSSATGMQAIPATGMAQGIAFLEYQNIRKRKKKPVVLCSIGDGALTEGEVSEAIQMAVLKQLPIIYLVQDNDWGISARGDEMRAMDAYQFGSGFTGLRRMRIDGSEFVESYLGFEEALDYVRRTRKPVLIHAKCPLLGHHTSGVRKEWYRSEEDLHLHQKSDPHEKMFRYLVEQGFSEKELSSIEASAVETTKEAFRRALEAPDPDPLGVVDHVFAPTPIVKERGKRNPTGAEKILMVDAALHATEEIMNQNPEVVFYGQDVGENLGGVFREAAHLAEKFGPQRVFNTPIQEAYIIGSSAGMTAAGCKPIVEIQFADYLWPGINQLAEEISKSCYLTMGRFRIQSLIRVPIGAYGGGGPYHSGSIESTLLNIRGIKVVYPSNAADMKGLFKAAFHDPNPVVMLEHKGLYWSKVPGTQDAKTYEPDSDYIIPLGKARVFQKASDDKVRLGDTLVVITYGMGVFWAQQASVNFPGLVEILDLRTLNPLDWISVVQSVKRHNKALILTEEPLMNSFAESLAGRLSNECFQNLDAPIGLIGSQSLPAVPLNVELELEMLPNPEKVQLEIGKLLQD